MKSLNFAPVRETQQQQEEDLSRMNDEGCPNDPVPSLPNETGIEGARNSFGPQPLLDLVGAVRSHLSMEIEEADEGDLIASIVA
jgi:hypothetical protein